MTSSVTYLQFLQLNNKSSPRPPSQDQQHHESKEHDPSQDLPFEALSQAMDTHEDNEHSQDFLEWSDDGQDAVKCIAIDNPYSINTWRVLKKFRQVR